MVDLSGVRRSRRDWAVDWLGFLFAAGVGAASFSANLADTTTSRADAAASAETYISPVVLIADVVAGVLCCLALWLGRRWPAGVALVIAPMSAFSTLATGAGIVALLGLAVRRPVGPGAPNARVLLCSGGR
jgi:hypothetical protein